MRTAQHGQRGFTLIEMLFVTAIIGILAAVALPNYNDYIRRSKVAEGLTLAEPVRRAVADYYDRWGRLPGDNTAAGLPAPEHFAGRYVAAITVVGGAVQVAYRDGVLAPGGAPGARLNLRPAVNTTLPTSPLVWDCDGREIREGYVVSGASAPALDGGALGAPCK